MTDKAKTHPLLASIRSSIDGKLPSTFAFIQDHKYSLQLLKPEGEEWVASNTVGTTPTAILMNVRKPTVAASLTAIDDIPVETLFQLPDSIDAATKERVLNNSDLLRDWRRSQVLDFVRNGLDGVIVEALYSAYVKMAEEHKQSLRELENLSKEEKTPT